MLSSDIKHWEHPSKSHFLLAVSEKSKADYFVCWECPHTSGESDWFTTKEGLCSPESQRGEFQEPFNFGRTYVHVIIMSQGPTQKGMLTLHSQFQMQKIVSMLLELLLQLNLPTRSWTLIQQSSWYTPFLCLSLPVIYQAASKWECGRIWTWSHCLLRNL